jgi:hypothetical protein
VSAVTRVPGDQRYLWGQVEETSTGATAMENLSKRTTAIIAVCFLLFAAVWELGWQKVVEESYPPVHCDYHFQHLTCTAMGKAARAV